VKPLRPDKFVWMEVGGQASEGATTVARGLWEAPDGSYHWFCEHFMKCVISTTEWKL
jgi:hypothetical protein